MSLIGYDEVGIAVPRRRRSPTTQEVDDFFLSGAAAPSGFSVLPGGHLVAQGDCLKRMEALSAESVDLVLTDLPYGTTACKWDSVIPLDKLWVALHRVSKPSAVVVFTAQQPFTWALCASNAREFRYELIWEKPNGTNPFHAKLMPMKKHENVLVFCRKAPSYRPQMVEGRPYKWNAKRSGGEAGGINPGRDSPIDNTGTRYPGSVLRFGQERGLHPTQKPVSLMEWLIRTYCDEKAVVLDCTMGSGTAGVACVRTDRRFIGIELDRKYYELAVRRMADAIAQGAASGSKR